MCSIKVVALFILLNNVCSYIFFYLDCLKIKSYFLQLELFSYFCTVNIYNAIPMGTIISFRNLNRRFVRIYF